MPCNMKFENCSCERSGYAIFGLETTTGDPLTASMRTIQDQDEDKLMYVLATEAPIQTMDKGMAE